MDRDKGKGVCCLQAEDVIGVAQEYRGVGDVYHRQLMNSVNYECS